MLCAEQAYRNQEWNQLLQFVIDPVSDPVRSDSSREVFGMRNGTAAVLNPAGQGFIAAASMKRAGKVRDMAARAMETVPSSEG